MRLVIDEYGLVAGLVTIEDLLEQIVGDIKDEHETDTPVEDPQREPGGSWLVPGSFPVDQLVDLFLVNLLRFANGYEAATLGGLVSEIEGRIRFAARSLWLIIQGCALKSSLPPIAAWTWSAGFSPPRVETAAARVEENSAASTHERRRSRGLSTHATHRR